MHDLNRSPSVLLLVSPAVVFVGNCDSRIAVSITMLFCTPRRPRPTARGNHEVEVDMMT